MNYNPLHYPTFDRCKKLTELWFPETERWFFKEKDDTEFIFTTNYWETNNPSYDRYVCPSVMEMMDTIPNKIGTFKFRIEIHDSFFRSLYREIDIDITFMVKEWTLPNILADTIISLAGNNHLSFKFDIIHT